jgi:hypothetical protein
MTLDDESNSLFSIVITSKYYKVFRQKTDLKIAIKVKVNA